MILRQNIISGLKWTALGKVLSQVVSWSVTIFVVRLLAPSDYGLLAVAMTVITFLNHINEFGLNSALVQSKEVTDQQCGAVFGLMLLISSGMITLLSFLAPFLATYFEKPELSSIFVAISFSFLISAIGTVPNALLRRQMNFKALANVELVKTLYTSLITLVLAQFNYGVWSLVVGNLIGNVVGVLMLYYVYKDFTAPNFKWNHCHSLLQFGCYLTGNRIIWWFMAQADVLIGAKLLNKEALGIYYVALDLGFMPMIKIMSTFNQVIFSATAKIQEQKSVLKQGLLEGIWWICYALLPALVGLIITAPEFVPILLGDKWIGVTVPFQLISMAVFLRIINVLFSTFNTAVGRIDVDFRNTLTGVIILLPCFWYGVQQGEIGLAAAWPIGGILIFALNFPKNSMVSGVRLREIVFIALKPFCASLIMAVSVIFFRDSFYIYISKISLLVTMILAGALIYFLIMLSIDRHFRYQVGKLLRGK